MPTRASLSKAPGTAIFSLLNELFLLYFPQVERLGTLGAQRQR
jgi:hypothetical protein